MSFGTVVLLRELTAVLHHAISLPTCLALLLTLLSASGVTAQEWAVKMFDGTSHDFQTVARGAKAIHRFKVKNIYEEDAHISAVRSSCGCTTPQIVKPDLKTFEVGEIVAEFNTRTLTGYKSATITVNFDKPFPAEVQLNVSGFIRSDVVVQPGEIDLGTVELGAGVEKKIAIAYAGTREDWRVVDAKTANPHFEVELFETARGGGRVNYDMLVRLTKDCPAGFVKDQLILVTNDAKGTEMPVDIEGRVLSALSVYPASLFMGVVQPGQKVTKQLIVRGKKPFRITEVLCNDKSFAIEPSSEAKTVHQVPVVFTAGDRPAKITQSITILTDQGEEATAKCTAYAQIVERSTDEAASNCAVRALTTNSRERTLRRSSARQRRIVSRAGGSICTTGRSSPWLLLAGHLGQPPQALIALRTSAARAVNKR